MADNIIELLNRLHISEDLNTTAETLEQLKTAVSALSPTQLSRILPNVSISNVFRCLNTPIQQTQQLCGEILDRMLSSISSPVVLEHFHSQILAWLRLTDVNVQALCLPLLKRLSLEAPEQMSSHVDLVGAVVNLLSHDSQNVGPAAVGVLTLLGKSQAGLLVLFSQQLVHALEVVMQKNDISRFRVYQIAIDLAVHSAQALDLTSSSGLLNGLIKEVGKDDILVQLNAVELLSDLARSHHGLVFLDQRGIVKQLEQMIANLANNPLGGVLLPGLIKFFGGLARDHPKEVLSKFDRFVREVLSNASSTDATMKGVSLDTVAFIGTTPEGKLALQKLGNPMTEVVHSIGSSIKAGTSEERVRALRAMTGLVYLQEEHQTTELLALTESWFTSSMQQPLNCVWSIAQQPFSDLRIPALQLLHSLAHCPWGQQLMNSTPGFREYVLDRSTESTKEGKDEKFELVKVLAHSPTVVEVFGAPYKVKLMEYFNQGPHYVIAQTEVALDGQ